MMNSHPLYRYLSRHPSLPGLIYLGLVVVFCLTTVCMLVDIVERYDARNASLAAIARLDAGAQDPSALRGGQVQSRPLRSQPPGSPLLEGQTITLASAALLQRITGAVTDVGGSLASSEIEPQGGQAKDGFVRAMATFEIDQVALQALLYNIEAGMPFLFIDQLSVQMPMPADDGARMRVHISVSGLWQGGK
jgi:general secretion pathway protein M